MKKLIIDIETIRANDYKLFMPEFKEPKDKRSKSIKEQQKEWESKLALSPLTGQIACVGVSYNDNISVEYQGLVCNEKKLIEIILKYYLMPADLIIGHNIKDFDLWFIFNRCRKHGLEFPRKLYNTYKGRFTWQDNIIDTMDLWSCGKYKEYISLDNLAKFFGIEGKDNTISKNFEEVWNADRNKAIEHCRKDVLLTKQIYELLK